MPKVVDESFIVLEPGFQRISERGGVVDEDGVIYLASAVLKQAVLDFKSSTKWLGEHPEDDSRQRQSIEKLKKETWRFFRSNWFHHLLLADCDNDKVIKALQSAV